MQSDLLAEGFAGMAVRLRGRTGLSQRDLAAQLGVHLRSIQFWEAGGSHPKARRLQGLIAILLDAGAFADGVEQLEAEALWNAAMMETSRLQEPFDAAWFISRLQLRKPGLVLAVVEPPQKGAERQYWGDAPAVAGFLGRTDERETAGAWVLDEECGVLAIVGLGGIGKTQLAARVAYDVAPHFEHLYWRSLRNGLPFGEWLQGAIGFLAPQDALLMESDAARMDRLLWLIQKTRALLILDNLETVLLPGGGYQPDAAGYGEVLRRLADTPHRSCLLVTSREEPAELRTRTGAGGRVRVLGLDGLAVENGRALLEPDGLFGDPDAWRRLITRYGGNALALKMIGASVRELFGGDISAYLADVEVAQGALFGDVRELLDAQMSRVSGLEREVMRWLAIEREPVSFVELAADLGPATGRGPLRDAVEALRRRSLLERRQPGPTFTLQSVVLEYATEQLVGEVAHGVAGGDVSRLVNQPLIKAMAKEYARRSQERLIAEPVLHRLVATLGSRQVVERQLSNLLDKLRRKPREEHGYGPGNIVNLARLLRGDLKQMDLSNLVVRQAYLREVNAQDASLAGAHVSECALPEAFHQITVELSPDGTHLLAGTTTGEVCLWRAADRTLLVSATAHAGVVMGVALCADRGLAASASQDGTVKLWEAGSGRPLATLQGHSDFVQGVALSRDGELVASASQDGTVKLWQAPGGELLRTLRSTGGGVLSVVLSPDGTFVCGGMQSGMIAVWDTASGQLVAALAGHTGAVPGVALSGDARLLASASHDGTAKLWDIPARTERATLTGHSGGVWDVALSGDGELVASAGQDGSVRLWSTKDGQPLTTLLGHHGGIWCLSMTADGEQVASAGQDGSVRVWEVSSGHLLTSLQGHTSAMWDVALSGDGRYVASGSQDGTLKVWNTTDGAVHAILRGHDAGVQGVVLNHHGGILGSASQDGSVNLWDVGGRRLLTTLSGHAGAVWDVALSTDSQLVVSAGYDGTIKVWNAPAGRLVTTLEGHTRGVRGIALNDARHLIVSGSQDGLLKLWDAHDWHLLATLEGHTGGVLCVAIDTSGHVLASGGFDGNVKVWDAVGGDCVATMAAHVGGALCVALSADGRLLASGGFDHAVKLWDVPSGRLAETLVGHTGAVWGVAMSSDGRLLASASFDGTVGLWDVPSGAHLRTLTSDRPFERTDIFGLTGVTATHRAALAALGAVDGRAGTITP
ncbi:MAG: helix-turn-helix domain-containing protein [Chloroflexi bacterium]|nr:helix-turn-helix domain-containing protein [Chloroflexota bacterium]